MQLWTGFLLGLAGSVHCAAMCGPLVLAVPPAGKSAAARVASRLVYNGGRMATYALLGLIFGAVGQSVALAGFQQWVSILAGSAVLLTVLFSSKGLVKTPVIRGVSALKSAFGSLLQRRTLSSNALLGSLNGFLPCGLAYTACAGAAATASAFRGAEYMAAFGLGTVPMLLGIAYFGGRLRAFIPALWQRAFPAFAILTGCLLIVRGVVPGVHSATAGGKPGHACPLCK